MPRSTLFLHCRCARYALYLCAVLMMTHRCCYGMNIYVNPRENGTCCEENGTCQSLNLALECLQQHNQTTVWIEPGLYYLMASADAATSTAYEFHWMQDIAVVALSDALNSTNGSEIPVQVICRNISTDNGAGMTFINSTNVTIRGIMFDQCGVYQYSTSHTVDGSDFFQFFAAIYFMLCRDITLEYVHVNGTKGIGTVIYSTIGLNRIQQCNFSHNAVESEGTIPGGGGVYIEFSYCLPMAGDLNVCDNGTNVPSFNTDNAQYLIEFTTFYKNNATVTNATDLTFILPHRSDHVAFGRGGGLSVFFKGNAFNDIVTVRNCSFIANHAMWGAGLFVEYQDNAQNNVFEISLSHVDSNICHNSESESKGTGGGGARIGYIFFKDSYGNVRNNSMTFDDVEFTGNKAYYGGGLSFYTAREKASASPTNRLSFKNCLWQRNTARVGSGADISVWHPIPAGAVVEPSFANCTFYNNSAQYTSNLGSQVGVGALYIDSVPVTFSGAVWFIANTQTALAAISTGLYFDRGCRAHFSSNQGRNGGAIALLGDAFIRVSNLTRMFFLNNTAELKGGAIYGHSIGEHDLISSRNCFIRYEDVQATPLNWTAKFSFKSNTLIDGSNNSIYVTSLLTCLWGGAFGSTESIQDAADRVFCWGDQWQYAGNCSDEISTSPASFSPELRKDDSTVELDDDNTPRHGAMMEIYAIPGMRTNIDISTFDDRGNDVTSQTVFTASMKDNSNVNISLDSSFLYISDNKFELHGEPNSTGVLNLETIDPRVISTQINVTLQQCPPGLVKGDEGARASCLCAGDYGGYIVCNGSTFSAKILRGSWIGEQGTDTELEWIVGQCPYCSSFGSELLIQLPQNASKLSQCAQVNRRGELCGRCIEGYGPVVNGDFQCVDCSSSVTKYHWFFYLLTEFLPIVIFFFVVIFLNVSATSGPANAFVFFAQVITTAFTVTGDGVIQIKSLANTTTAHALKDLYTIPYDIWNLNFFHPFLPEFCLSSKITTLQLLSTGYITALFPLLLVITFYLFVYLYSRGVKPIVYLCRPLHHCFARFRGIIWNFERSVLHALATFLLLSYTKFSLVSFILLTPTPLLKNTGEKDRFVLYYDGTIDFFSKDHAPYIIVSLIVLVTFVLLPPFVLILPSISHLVRLCLQKFNYEGNLLSYRVGSVTGQFMTAFYECYKDGTGDPSGQTDNNNQDFRWFAGMYFIFRLMVFATFAFTPDWFMQYVILQFICICGLLSFSLLRPYKNDWYNRLDATIFAILSAINSLSMYNYFLAVLDKSPSVWVFSIQYLFIMCPLVYMVIFVLQYLVRKYREKAVRCFKRTWPFSKHFVGDGDEGNEDFLEYTQGTGRLEGDLEYSINIADARNRQRSMQEELNHHFGSETQALLLEDPAQEAPAEENPGNSNSGSSGYGATGSGSATEDSLTPSENSTKSDSKARFYQYGVEKLLFEEPQTDQKDKRRRLFRTK